MKKLHILALLFALSSVSAVAIAADNTGGVATFLCPPGYVATPSGSQFPCVVASQTARPNAGEQQTIDTALLVQIQQTLVEILRTMKEAQAASQAR